MGGGTGSAERPVIGFEVVISAAAEGDIATSFSWYRERNSLVADAFRAEVFDMIDAIAESPLGRPVSRNMPCARPSRCGAVARKLPTPPYTVRPF